MKKTQVTIDEIGEQISQLSDHERLRAKKRNKSASWSYGLLVLLYVALAVLAFTTGARGAGLTLIGYTVWVALIYIKERHIIDQDHTIRMLTGLRDIERGELNKFVTRVEEAAK